MTIEYALGLIFLAWVVAIIAMTFLTRTRSDEE